MIQLCLNNSTAGFSLSIRKELKIADNPKI